VVVVVTFQVCLVLEVVMVVADVVRAALDALRRRG
jgi:hypothetical protein